MDTWPQDELRSIAETDDLHISPFRDDGKTYGTPTWIAPSSDFSCRRARSPRR